MSKSFTATGGVAHAPDLKYPVIDYSFHCQATDEGKPESSVSCLVHAMKSVQRRSLNVKVVNNENLKVPIKDHVWSRESCANHGCKDCCGCVFERMQCDRCAAENIFAQAKEIHEGSLREWDKLEYSEADGFVEAGLEVVTHEMALCDLHQEPVTDFEQEKFEVVDGQVEMDLMGGKGSGQLK